jgi:hypothetical protein
MRFMSLFRSQCLRPRGAPFRKIAGLNLDPSEVKSTEAAARPSALRQRVRPWSALTAGLACAHLVLAGCATPGDPYVVAPAATQLTQEDKVGACLRLLKALDARVDAAGRRDAQDVRVPGYPYLRADRFTEQWLPAKGDPQTIAAGKLDRMAALDAEARRFESANLSVSAGEADALARCRSELIAAARPMAPQAAASARVPDAYVDAQRLVGLYPVTLFPFALGVASWQQTTRELFATPFPELVVRGERIRYVPAAGKPEGTVAGLMSAPTSMALSMPVVTPERAWQLLVQHAPVLIVDTVDGNDRIGSLTWRASVQGAVLAVNTYDPAAYVRVAWTQFNGAAALQLVYTFWFPARPAAHTLDLVAGHLDAVVWRVTLDAAGRPLVYDSIHACGCFQMFFPTERVRERPAPRDGEGPLDESLFVPQVLYSPAADERVMVFLGAHDHNIERVGIDTNTPAPGIPYRLLDENLLRALPVPAAAGGGTRSIYGPDGLVPGTERAERYLFWPMGVPSAGQMRQWGHHATAFVGRRHFDDPHLFDRYFSLAPGAD